jgi:hypothetical protein
MEVKIKNPCPYQELNPRGPAYSPATILRYLARHCLREMALIKCKQIYKSVLKNTKYEI